MLRTEVPNLEKDGEPPPEGRSEVVLQGVVTGVDTTQGRRDTQSKFRCLWAWEECVHKLGDNDGAGAREVWIHNLEVQEEDVNASPDSRVMRRATCSREGLFFPRP